MLNKKRFGTCLLLILMFLSCFYLTQFAHAATVTYTIHGPYYEDGTLDVTDTLTATLYQSSAATLTHTFNGSSPDWVLNLTQPAICITWNLTDTYNYTRTYYFTQATTDEVWLYLPPPNLVYQQYSVNTIILGGLTNAYGSTMENVNGDNRIIERQPVDVINAVPFWLTMYRAYTFQLVSDQGTWNWNLPADTIQQKTFTITADMINNTVNLNPFSLSATATRINGTSLSVYYNDPTGTTTSVTTQILHISAGQYYQDYIQTDNANTQSFTMTNATATTYYVANFTASRGSTTQTWQVAIEASPATQVFEGAFAMLGTLPIPDYQLPAMFICLLFFGIGNWRDSEATMILCIIVMGFLQVIGWASFPAPGIALAAMIVIMIYVYRAKQENTILES